MIATRPWLTRPGQLSRAVRCLSCHHFSFSRTPSAPMNYEGSVARRDEYLNKLSSGASLGYQSCRLTASSHTGAAHGSQQQQQHISPSLLVHRSNDFSGEPVTFLLPSSTKNKELAISDLMTALDKFALSVVSRGKTANGGGDRHGISSKAAHSVAIEWANILSCFKYGTAAPMLVCAAISPLLALTGVAYTNYVDSILDRLPNNRVTLMLPMARATTTEFLGSGTKQSMLSLREQYHVQTLHFLLRDEHSKALATLLKLLKYCPGDILALSLAIDISTVVGDSSAALRGAASVAAYWTERSSTFGSSIAMSLVSLGLAAGGKTSYGERLADRASNKTMDLEGSSGVAAWALANVYDAEGRASEGRSLLAGPAGIRHYESCGFLFFDSKLAGYGAAFVLDQEGARADRTGIRLYDSYFDRVLMYSKLYAKDDGVRTKRAPQSKKETLVNTTEGAVNIFFGNLFGSSKPHEEKATSTDIVVQGSEEQKVSEIQPASSVEDVLSWLPPTPQFLTDATFLLLRLTFCGALKTNDQRWHDLRMAWDTMLDIQEQYYSKNVSHDVCSTDRNRIFDFFPRARVAFALVVHSEKVESLKEDHAVNSTLIYGANLMGSMMQLGGENRRLDDDGNADMLVAKTPSEAEGWKRVLLAVTEARDNGSIALGTDSLRESSSSPALYKRQHQDLIGWDMDIRPFFEHAICHSACQAGDYESLCTARALCSESVSLRPNSPEAWWRYSTILDKLGDHMAAENARAVSVSLGSGEGGSGAH